MRLLRALFVTILILTVASISWGADAEIDALQSDVEATKSKAEENTNKIKSMAGGLPALEARLAELENGGVQGPPGPQGEVGPAGPPGPQGEIGPAGEQGMPGALWISGNGPPTDSGIEGEIYLDKNTGDVYRMGVTAWEKQINIMGPQGPPGPIDSSVSDAVCDLYARLNLNSPPSFCTSYKLVFTSSVVFSGDLGGLIGADDKCQQLAMDAALSGTFKAWLSDSNEAARDRLSHSELPYLTVNLVSVAANWVDLTDGSLSGWINVDENGNVFGNSFTNAWTNTKSDGSLYTPIPSDSCNDWQNATSGKGHISKIYASNIGTASHMYFYCDAYNHLICVQQ